VAKKRRRAGCGGRGRERKNPALLIIYSTKNVHALSRKIREKSIKEIGISGYLAAGYRGPQNLMLRCPDNYYLIA